MPTPLCAVELSSEDAGSFVALRRRRTCDGDAGASQRNASVFHWLVAQMPFWIISLIRDRGNCARGGRSSPLPPTNQWRKVGGDSAYPFSLILRRGRFDSRYPAPDLKIRPEEFTGRPSIIGSNMFGIVVHVGVRSRAGWGSSGPRGTAWHSYRTSSTDGPYHSH